VVVEEDRVAVAQLTDAEGLGSVVVGLRAHDRLERERSCTTVERLELLDRQL